jgi:hypothetical protein
MEILSSAVLSGKCDVDIVERLTRLSREQVEYQAMVEFNDAMHRCQQQMKHINTDMQSDKGRYASYKQVDKAIRSIYTGEGISLSFSDGEPIAPDSLRLLCYVSRGGYTRVYHKDMPIDTKGAKGNDVMTRTHAQGSADSYAKRYLVKDIFNLAVVENDDDGNGGAPMEDTEFVSWRENILTAANEDDLRKYFNAAFQEATKAKDKLALQSFRDARDKRRKELTQ